MAALMESDDAKGAAARTADAGSDGAVGTSGAASRGAAAASAMGTSSAASRSASPQASAAGAASLDALRKQLHDVVRVFSAPLGRNVAMMIAASEQDTELSKVFRNHFILARREEGRAFLEQAAANREIRSNLDIEVALDLIYAPVFYRLLMGHAPLNATFTDAVLDLALQGLEPLNESAQTRTS
jgi:hypothetical protein